MLTNFSNIAGPCSAWKPLSLQALRDGRGMCDYGRDHAQGLFHATRKTFVPLSKEFQDDR